MTQLQRSSRFDGPAAHEDRAHQLREQLLGRLRAPRRALALQHALRQTPRETAAATAPRRRSDDASNRPLDVAMHGVCTNAHKRAQT